MQLHGSELKKGVVIERGASPWQIFQQNDQGFAVIRLSGTAHRPAHFILRMNYTRQRKNCQSYPKAKITVKVCTICTGRVEIRPAHDN